MNMKEIKNAVGDAAENLKDATVATGETIQEKSSEAFHAAEKKTKEFCRQAGKVVCDAKDEIVETGQTIAEKTTEVANEAAKKASKLYHSMTD